MAVVNPPWALQNSAGHTAKLFRRALGGMLGSEGIAAYIQSSSFPFGLSGDLGVTQRGAGANMSVDVARGGCYILGDDATDQGYYFAYNDATLNVAVTAADPTNPRRDNVLVRIKDAAEGGAAGDTSTIEVAAGTPGASPNAPAVPASSLKIAEILVGAGVTSITNANITDFRTMATTALLERTTPSVKVYRTANQTITTTTWVAINFPTASATEAWDTDGLHDPSSNTSRITIPSLVGLGGKWLVEGQVAFASNVNNVRGAAISKNGSVIAYNHAAVTGASYGVGVQVHTILQLNSGDYVELNGWQDAAASLAVSGTGESSTWFAATRIG